MLVLSRKVNDRIRIGDDIELIVVRVAGDVVRIGISAPSNVKILREEIADGRGQTNRGNHPESTGDSVGTIVPPERVRNSLLALFRPTEGNDV